MEQEDHKDDHKEEYVEAAKQDEEHKGNEGKKEDSMRGIFITRRSLWLIAGGGIGALAALGLGRATKRVRPAAVGAVKEGYAFKEWIAGNFERLKEDVEDIVAEGVHHYQTDLAATADTVKREKEILEKIDNLISKRMAKIHPEKAEG